MSDENGWHPAAHRSPDSVAQTEFTQAEFTPKPNSSVALERRKVYQTRRSAPLPVFDRPGLGAPGYV